MTEATTAEHAAQRMRAVAAELAAAGMDVHMRETRASVDLTATAHPVGRREIEAVVDEDGYVELRYWHAPGATPAQVSETITHAIDAIAHSQ